MFMLGLAPVLGIVYAVLVAFLIYFGIKVLIGRQRRTILDTAGEGLCADCGQKLDAGKCPQCNPV